MRVEQKIRRRPQLTYALIALISLLLVVQVIVSNTLSTTGETITQIDQEINTLKEENQLITEQIASSSALLAIEERATILGFSTLIKPVYLPASDKLPVAVKLP